MKKKYILSAASLALMMGMSSCVNDLDVTPIDPSTEMTPSEVELYTKCYANMALAGQGGANGDCDIDKLDGGTTGFVRQLFNAQELPTDECICSWGDPGIPEFNTGSWDASHPMLQGFYYRLYAGINYCNHYLDVCGGVNEQRAAEVRALRCLYYYYLLDCFGNVPFTTVLTMVDSPVRYDRATLYAWLETELKALLQEGNLLKPASRNSSQEGYGRIDEDGVNMLLARLYLNAEVYTGKAAWSDALTYAEAIITGPHKLFTNNNQYITFTDGFGTHTFSAYQMLFFGDNGETGASSEAIFALLQDGLKTTSWGTTLFLMASTWKADMDVMKDYNTTAAWAGNRARKEFVRIFFPEGNVPAEDIQKTAELAGDDRALLFGKGRSLEVNKTTEFTEGYSVGKFRNTYSDGSKGHDAEKVDADFFLMRTGEAYLIAAEAALRANNDKSTCAKYINELRSRAHAKKVSPDDCTLDLVLDERAKELYYEGFRRTDLIRFGKFGGNSNYVWEWKGGTKTGVNFEEYRNLYPIPSADINTNNNLKQNQGYK